MFKECTFWSDVYTVCCKMGLRQDCYFRAIAYQAIWFAHIAAREAETTITVQTIRQTYFGLLMHYRQRTTKKQLRRGCPPKTYLAIFFTPSFPGSQSAANQF